MNGRHHFPSSPSTATDCRNCGHGGRRTIVVVGSCTDRDIITTLIVAERGWPTLVVCSAVDATGVDEGELLTATQTTTADTAAEAGRVEDGQVRSHDEVS